MGLGAQLGALGADVGFKRCDRASNVPIRRLAARLFDARDGILRCGCRECFATSPGELLVFEQDPGSARRPARPCPVNAGRSTSGLEVSSGAQAASRKTAD